jgi:antitoxin (DNA-binding transcriptional repressor) of toxin-antitoxin stability system
MAKIDHMESIGIRELRANLTTAARRAGAGERVVVTIDGRPVAQLGPLEPVDRTLSIHDLASRGLITPARRSDRPEPDFVLPMWAGTRTDQLVREIRGR